jgi:RimJ/RimL family protein N-acetyltransferase
LSAGGTLIGTLGLGRTPKSVAYFLAPSLWGRGLMTEALQRFLSWTCLRFGLHQITADHFADNPSSGRVLEKLGFVKTGSARLGSAASIGTALGYTYCLDCEHLSTLPTRD